MPVQSSFTWEILPSLWSGFQFLGAPTPGYYLLIHLASLPIDTRPRFGLSSVSSRALCLIESSRGLPFTDSNGLGHQDRVLYVLFGIWDVPAMGRSLLDPLVWKPGNSEHAKPRS